MADDNKSGKERADHLHEVIDRLTAGAARPIAPTPTGTKGESLREAIHRRMRELDASQPSQPSDAEERKPDDASS
ncbi:hypothetical protein [Streptomyces sp. NPDC047009]|uniref:hypothetical protein n=1 Tax=Streptomyces sp. NPDC047009 TaxID=3154496 RepID=UPI0033CC082C